MNTDQKTRITRLRSEGASYNQIAQELGISKNTVSTFCRRNGLTGDAAETAPSTVTTHTCKNCGNGYTECTNRLIRENNLRGRGYSFEVLRARTLYRKTNLRAMLENGLIDVGPVISEDQPVFHFESAKEDEDEDLEDDYEPFPNPEEE